MGKGGGRGENSKAAAGNAKKAQNAAVKAAAEQAKSDAAESSKWSQGAKSNKKAEDAASKKADAERKKAEKAALLAAEEADAPSKPKSSKQATKKGSAKPAAAAPARKLDLSQLDDDGGFAAGGGAGSSASAAALNASGIDNALDALALTGGSAGADKVERHPERRYKAALAAYEEKRMPELEKENPGLRRNQRMELLRKEFEKSDDNPFNQASVAYNASKGDVVDFKAGEKKKIEDRLAN